MAHRRSVPREVRSLRNSRGSGDYCNRAPDAAHTICVVSCRRDAGGIGELSSLVSDLVHPAAVLRAGSPLDAVDSLDAVHIYCFVRLVLRRSVEWIDIDTMVRICARVGVAAGAFSISIAAGKYNGN